MVVKLNYGNDEIHYSLHAIFRPNIFMIQYDCRVIFSSLFLQIYD